MRALFLKKLLLLKKFKNLAGKEDRYWYPIIKKKFYDPSLTVLHHYTTNGNTWKV